MLVSQRLLERLDRAGDVVLVRAPTGFGKSMLLRRWTETREQVGAHTVWVRLGAAHRTPADFWRQVVLALEPVARLRPRGAPSASLVRALLEDEARPTTLVVDGLERVATEALVTDLLQLVDEDDALSVAVCAQAAVLPRASSGDALDLFGDRGAVLEGAELALTPAEAVQLFTASGAGRVPQTVVALHHDVGGWPLLLQRVALGLAGTHGHVTDTVVTARIVREHVARELLDGLTEDDRHRVGLLALPSRLTCATAATVLNIGEMRAAWTLDGVGRSGLVRVARSNGELVYTWPPALREALWEWLAAETPELVSGAEGRLARWHRSRREYREALEHASRADDVNLEAEIVDQAWLPLLVYDNDLLAQVFQRAPAALFDERPHLRGVRDLSLRMPGDPPSAPFELPDDVESVLVLARSPDVRAVLNVGMVRLFGLRRSRRLDEALELADRLRDIGLTARVESPGQVSDLLAPIFLLTAIVHELTGDIAGATAALRWGVDTAPDSVLRGSARHCSAHLAMDLALLGDIGEAATWIERVDTTPSVAGWVSARAHIAVLVARLLVATERLDHDDARSALRDLLATADPLDELWPFVLFARAQYALVWGDRWSVVQQVLRERAAHPEWTTDSALDELVRSAEVDLLVALGHAQRATATLAATRPDAGERGPSMLEVSRARVLLLTGQPEAAIALVREQLLTRPASPRVRHDLVLLEIVALRRLDQDDRAADLLGRALRDTSAPSLRALAMVPRADLLALAKDVPEAQNVGGQLARHGVPELVPVGLTPVRLTPRELVILTHLAAGLSRDEIARHLSVSVHTVKSQTHSVYRKLGVRSRSQALLAAQEQGVLPASSSEALAQQKDERRG